MSRSTPPVPHKDPRGRRRPVGYDRAAPLSPIDLETHKQLVGAHKIMSGRRGGYVYSWRNGKLHRRRHVIPKDPRTPAQRGCRDAFGKASNAWSQNQALTQTQRGAWHAAAAKIKSKPRLGTSGFLTAQNHFVGSSARKERWGFPLLLEPPARGRKDVGSNTQNTGIAPQAPQPQTFKLITWKRRRASAVRAPSQRHAAKGGTGMSNDLRVPIQVTNYQALTRPSSERPHTSSTPLPVQCLWSARSPSHFGSIFLPRWSSSLAQIRRTARFRELWRGG